MFCGAVWHAAENPAEKFAAGSRSFQFRKGEGLPGRVWAENNSVWISNVTTDPNFPRASLALEANLRGAFAFPLCADGEVNGVVELFSREELQPDEDLLQMVESLGIQIGLFIERRRIERELKREKESAEAAKNTVVNALIGIVLIILSYVIVNLVINLISGNAPAATP